MTGARPYNVIITGVGGQGNVLAARLLGSALLKAGFETSVGDVFGLAQRGGSVASHIRFWRGPALPPLVPRGKLDLVVGFEPLEALRVLAEYGHAGTHAIVNEVAVPPIGVLMGRTKYPAMDRLMADIGSLAAGALSLDAVELSHRAGDAQALNMVMMGALGGGLMPLSAAELEEEMIGSLPVRFADTNRRAFRLGVGAAQRWARADGGVPRAPAEN